MIDHLTLNVSNLETSKAFYSQALAPLGYELTLDFLGGCGFAVAQKPDFFLAERGAPSKEVHVAFVSEDRRGVDEFHAAALAAGAADNGTPGIRRVYHDFYYGAYVIDPDGNNIEAVTHRPE